MSCYEWERGSVKIPADQWSAFKKNLINHYNKNIQKDYQLALTIYTTIMELAKGKRKFDYASAYRDLRYETYRDYKASWYEWACIETSMFPLNASGKLKKPKALNFKKKTNKDTQLGPNITLNNNTRTVVWDVEENNRACDTARDTRMGIYFFHLLSKVNWKRGSGGTIVGNDEYNREADYEGGGGNYIKNQYPADRKFTLKRSWDY